MSTEIIDEKRTFEEDSKKDSGEPALAELDYQKNESGESGRSKKYIVRYYRKKCIGAFTCTFVAPDDWLVAPDGKASLAKSKKLEDGVFEREISKEEYPKMKESADVCPVDVIEVREKG